MIVRRCRAVGQEGRCELARDHDGHHQTHVGEINQYHWSGLAPRANFNMLALRRCQAVSPQDGVTNGVRCERRRGHEGRHHVEVTMGPDKYPTVRRWPNTEPVQPPCPPIVIVRRIVCASFVAVTAWRLSRDGWLIGIVFPFAIVMVLNLYCEFGYRKERNGSRQAVGDRERAGTATDDSAGLTVGGAAGSTFTNARLVPLRSFKATRGAIAYNTGSGTGNTLSLQDEVRADARLSERDGDLPILAFKAAQLVFGFGDRWGARLDSVYGANWTGTSEAICTKGGHDGLIPYEWCSCGFYARRNPDDVQRGTQPNEVRVDVELSGRVIVYERGYRAQRQRILRVGIAPCWYCSTPSTVVGGVAPTPFVLTPDSNPIGARLVGFCDTHVQFAEVNVTVTVDRLAERLGVPVDSAPQLGRRHDRPYGA